MRQKESLVKMTSRNLLIQPVRTHSSQRSVNFLPALRYNIQDLRYVFLTNFSVLGTEETIRFPTNAELRDFYSLVFILHWFSFFISQDLYFINWFISTAFLFFHIFLLLIAWLSQRSLGSLLLSSVIIILK